MTFSVFQRTPHLLSENKLSFVLITKLLLASEKLSRLSCVDVLHFATSWSFYTAYRFAISWSFYTGYRFWGVFLCCLPCHWYKLFNSTGLRSNACRAPLANTLTHQWYPTYLHGYQPAAYELIKSYTSRIKTAVPWGMSHIMHSMQWF